jgi:aminoglycoside phosphotransferase (APT) family kinase protein
MRVERLLPGRPLGEFYAPATGELSPRVVTAVGDVLAGLRDLQFEVPARTILDGEMYAATVDTWADTLVDLGRRRFARFGDQLEARDTDVRRTVSDLLTFLASRRNIEPRVIHGDICGPNVLVDDDCRVTAVIDWGFFSVLAEPELDAAITSAVLDMYGPQAAATDATLTDAVVERFGLERDVVLAYKGVYALMTSNVYSPDGTDGHFAWCSAMLARPDVQATAAALAASAQTRG